MNPLFQQMNTSRMTEMLKSFQQFKQTFTGDPKQSVQMLLNSGKISQAQYNNAVELAKQIQQMLK